jgi:hypothetical protein
MHVPEGKHHPHQHQEQEMAKPTVKTEQDSIRGQNMVAAAE